MKAVVLDSAAGGDFRNGIAVASIVRRPGQVTVGRFGVGSRRWPLSGDAAMLINASPDLGQQLRRTPALWPRQARQSPVGGVVLISADIDHVPGLTILRGLGRPDSARRLRHRRAAMIGLDARPKLASGVRLREDRVCGGFNLLAPEHVLRVNASSAAILNLRDIVRRLRNIANLLAAEYEVNRARIERDAIGLIEDLAGRRMVET